MLYYDIEPTNEEIAAMQAYELADQVEREVDAMCCEAEHYLDEAAREGRDLDYLIELYDMTELYIEGRVMIVRDPYGSCYLIADGTGAWCDDRIVADLLDGKLTATDIAAYANNKRH